MMANQFGDVRRQQPVNLGRGITGTQLDENGESVNNVAHRRRLDEQNTIEALERKDPISFAPLP